MDGAAAVTVLTCKGGRREYWREAGLILLLFFLKKKNKNGKETFSLVWNLDRRLGQNRVRYYEVRGIREFPFPSLPRFLKIREIEFLIIQCMVNGVKYFF